MSGINYGANMGLDIISSGTVGEVFQGYRRAILPIVVSVESFGKVPTLLPPLPEPWPAESLGLF